MSDTRATAPPARTPDPGFAATVQFRSATLDDVPALAPLINDAYLREAHVIPGPRINEIELRDQIAAPHSRIRIAIAGGAITGCVHVRLLDDGAWFGPLATHIAHQGRGLASLLIADAERIARDQALTTMRLECAAELGMPPYYSSLGYEVESEEPEYYSTSSGPTPKRKGPITRIVMRKDLT